MKDLSTQQLTLATSDYDLRITNLARFILKKLPIKQGSFIDVGAGNGLFLKFFKDRGFEVEGIELEKDQVHEMRKDFKLKDVKISQGDITNLHGKESYDVVIASDVIEHIQNDEVALTNLFTFVKKGGYLVLTVPAHMHLYG
ncbi:MAG: class I SAM-dependent methyltransferase, partial [Microgenomates group bacterium]